MSAKTRTQAHVRWMIRRDLQEVLRIEQESFGADAWEEEDFLSQMRQRNCIAMTAEIGDRVVGYAVYLMLQGHLSLLSLVVDSQYRRQGIGSQLLHKITSKIGNSTGRDRVKIDIPERETPALMFFKSCGFLAVKVSRAMYGADEDGIRMEWRRGRTKDRDISPG